jgi:hypothetical protein
LFVINGRGPNAKVFNLALAADDSMRDARPDEQELVREEGNQAAGDSEVQPAGQQQKPFLGRMMDMQTLISPGIQAGSVAQGQVGMGAAECGMNQVTAAALKTVLLDSL